MPSRIALPPCSPSARLRVGLGGVTRKLRRAGEAQRTPPNRAACNMAGYPSSRRVHPPYGIEERLPLEQYAVFGSEREGDLGAFVEQIGRRAAHDQGSGRPIDDVLDEIAVEQALADLPVRGVGLEFRALGRGSTVRQQPDMGGAHRYGVLVAPGR